MSIQLVSNPFLVPPLLEASVNLHLQFLKPYLDLSHWDKIFIYLVGEEEIGGLDGTFNRDTELNVCYILLNKDMDLKDDYPHEPYHYQKSQGAFPYYEVVNSEEEIFSTLAHELRHAWQFRKKPIEEIVTEHVFMGTIPFYDVFPSRKSEIRLDMPYEDVIQLEYDAEIFARDMLEEWRYEKCNNFLHTEK